MVVRRSGTRRRRLVVDPSQSAAQADAGSTAPTAAKRRKKSDPEPDVRAYSYGADRRNHHKTTDLIPKRVLSYLLLVLVVVSALAVINYGAVYAPHMEQHVGSEGVRALSIHGQGSIASWFSSFLLIMTGLASLQIYALRQHRCDDYGGTYRLWLWMAGLFLLASVNCIVNLGEVLTYLFQSVTQQSLTNSPWTLIGIKLTLLSLLVARGIFEVRESRGSIAWVLLVWVGYSAASLMQLPAARQSVSGVGPEMVVGNCLLVGTLGLFMAHLTYARFIFLQAHGLIKLREKKVVKRKKAAPKKTRAKKASAKNEVETTTAKPKSKPKSTKTKSKTAAKSKVQPEPETAPKVAAKSKKTTKQKAVAQSPEPSSEKENKEKKLKSGLGDGKKSPKDVLKELAEASRAKEKSKSSAKPKANAQRESEYEEDESEGVIKMSKAQRRKLRKAERNRKRAA